MKPKSGIPAIRQQSGGRWQRIREGVLRRDGGICRCARCKKSGALKVAHEVDHIKPIHQGGTDDDGNLCAINRECHKLKTAEELGKRRKPLIGLDGWPIEE